MLWLDMTSLAVIVALLAVFAPSLKKTGLRGLVVVALLAALGSASQRLLYMLPGIQLATVLVILCGILLGPGAGLMGGVVSQVFNGLLNSFGPWTIWQTLGMGLIGIGASFLPKEKDFLSKLLLPLYGFVVAFLFGWLSNISFFWFGPATWSAYLLYCVNGFFFDLSHALCNLALLSAASLPAFLKRLRPPKIE
jgi:energy-coupling factor transport system substrate-specific component